MSMSLFNLKKITLIKKEKDKKELKIIVIFHLITICLCTLLHLLS